MLPISYTASERYCNYIGQLAVFGLRDQAAPYYACLVSEDTPSTADPCSTSGVLASASLTGTIGSMQATEISNLLVFGGSPDRMHALPRRTGNAVDCGSRKKVREMLSVRIHLLIVGISQIV